jgi:carboxymethylenebutenolidase
MPMGPGVRGYAAVRAYYRDIFIPSWPDDLQTKLVNRIMGEDQLVDELHMVFTHDRAMEWLLPGVAPTHRTIEMDVVAVVQFRDGKLAGERIYWDQAAVLRQVGLLQQ